VDGHLLTGDSLLIGDAARPDLAVEAREGAEAMFNSLQRSQGFQTAPRSTRPRRGLALRDRDQFGSLVDHRCRGQDEPRARVPERGGVRRGTRDDLRHPAADRRARRRLNCGPFVGAQPPLERLEATTGRCSTCAHRASSPPATCAGRSTCRSSGSSLGTKAGFVLDLDRPVAIRASSPEEAETAAARLRAVGLLDLAGYLLDGPASETLEPIGVDELERLLAEDAVDLVDVREKDERDDGYIPESRHIPYRLVGEFAEELNNGRPVVTICESGARAAVAASVLAAHGVQARPVLDAGIPDLEQRGHALTSFRRCGSG
jgi:rhodanese-related sulfurtransferase